MKLIIYTRDGVVVEEIDDVNEVNECLRRVGKFKRVILMW